MTYFLSMNLEQAAIDGRFQSFGKIYKISQSRPIKKWLIGLLILLLFALFLPWTQNIRAKGNITTLRLEQRPQELNTVIGGSVKKWYVKEGDFVKSGDTILQIGEIKIDYFDPLLMERTQQQIAAKRQSMNGYKSKAGTAEVQTNALLQGQIFKQQSLDNKIQQQRSKVASDSADLIAVNNELEAFKRQLEAARVMLDSGAISMVDYERRRVNFQNVNAKRISTENKYYQGRQELINYSIEKNSIAQEYADKISKVEGDRFSSLATVASTEADVAKLQNLYAGYDVRNRLYFITAPQGGQVIKAKKAGIGEVLKEGEMIVEIVPTSKQYAVEMFVEPMDLPLINAGQKVRLVFDGFPAIVFSGWPKNSYGTFSGRVSSVESSVNGSGKFRVLVAEDPDDRKWPEQLRIGGGANAIALLKDVKIYYELWRNINGFPPEYYQGQAEK